MAIETAIVTSYSQDPGCASPVGVCTSGSIASGLLSGTTEFEALTMAPGASPDLIVYTGELVLTTSTGTITLRDDGLLNSATGAYIEMQQVVSGTGAYAQHNGMLISQGTANPTGFAGTLNGSICEIQAARPKTTAHGTVPL